jgi:hypothetical protein
MSPFLFLFYIPYPSNSTCSPVSVVIYLLASPKSMSSVQINLLNPGSVCLLDINRSPSKITPSSTLPTSDPFCCVTHLIRVPLTAQCRNLGMNFDIFPSPTFQQSNESSKFNFYVLNIFQILLFFSIHTITTYSCPPTYSYNSLLTSLLTGLARLHSAQSTEVPLSYGKMPLKIRSFSPEYHFLLFTVQQVPLYYTPVPSL